MTSQGERRFAAARGLTSAAPWCWLTALFLFALISTARAEGPPEPTAQEKELEACRQNRRCRLELLRNEMTVQRRDEARKLQQAAAMDQRHADRLKREGLPVRRARKLETDLFLSTTDRVGQGVLIGWGITENWRFELIGTFVAPEHSSINTSTTTYEHQLSYAAMGRVKWIPFESRLTPYVALGMAFQQHNYQNYSYYPPIGVLEGDVVDSPPSFGSSKNDAYAHLAVPAIGVDLQLRFGLHLGIELQYPIPIYTLFRDPNSPDPNSPNANDDAAKELMNQLKKKIAVGFVLGWAWDIL